MSAGAPSRSMPVASIVIPAHNEAAVIAQNLRRLLDGAQPGEFDVVVVANACTDDTACVARAAGVRVIETDRPGKAHALRMGDAECLTFPRAYVDADVEITSSAIRALVVAAQRPGVLACAPVPRFDLSTAGPVARRVHRVHDRMVAPGRALAGVGAYMLTAAGHARAFPLPDVLSDDGWVHNSFQPEERAVVPEAETVVRPARTVRAHLNRRIRVRLGNQQLAAMGRPAPQGRLGVRELRSLVASRQVNPLDAGCYLAVQSIDRLLTRLRGDGAFQWGHDASSRASTVERA